MSLFASAGVFRWLLVATAIGGFYLLEQRLPMLGVWLFVGLSLTLGMGHGALDTALLLGQFKPHLKALLYGLLYLVLTIFSAWVLSWSFAGALIALLLMSVWHFGELFAQRTVLRLAVGGASVMAPALLQNAALSTLLQGVNPQDANWLLSVWRGMAWVWAALACYVVVAFVRSGQTQPMFGDKVRPLLSRALLEITIVLILNAALSPLLAFALYFGLYHCTAHIARVQRATVRHRGLSKASLAKVWLISMVMTAVLMFALWRFLPTATQWAASLDAQLLQWLVVALGAVTVPHMLLVGYSDHWLGR
jgi:Brp/Blh family beta-carotene 15,15'-monooxygenase